MKGKKIKINCEVKLKVMKKKFARPMKFSLYLKISHKIEQKF